LVFLQYVAESSGGGDRSLTMAEERGANRAPPLYFLPFASFTHIDIYTYMLYAIYMIRTQVYLTKPQFQTIQRLAGKENKPAAKVIRELLDAGLHYKHRITAKEALLDLVRIGEEAGLSGPTDTSTSIDKILYGR
jgi:hypothetical protein